MKSFSRSTRFYLYATYLGLAAVIFRHGRLLEFGDPLQLLVLCVLASVGLIWKVEGSADRSYYTFSFVVYGFALVNFGITEALLIILVSNLVEWIWTRPPGSLQLFNIGTDLVAMEAAGVVYGWITNVDVSRTFGTTLAILVGMAIFNLINHLMVGIFLWLARKENFHKSRVFGFYPFLLDLSLLYFGASLSIVWKSNPFALVLFIIPAYLLYSALRVPDLQRRTEIDSKTGLFNHSYFKKQLENELARSNRYDRPLSVIIADLDLLRNINNTYGHLAGDEVLIGVARAMKHAVREYDVVCRFGGEEFAILLTETTLLQAYERAEMIRKLIEGMEFTVPTSRKPIRATMSFGVAHRERNGQTADEIVHRADLGLYHSKLSGRNRTFAYANQKYIDLPASSTESSEAATYASLYFPSTTGFGEYWMGDYQNEPPTPDKDRS